MGIDYSKWTVYKRGIISKSAPHVNLGKVCVKELFEYFRGSAYIRYVSDFDKAEDDKFYYVIKDGDFSMDTIPSKTRNMVRRCMKGLSIKRVDVQEIIDKGGYDVELSEHRRFERKGFASKVRNKEQWEKGMKDAQANGQEFWGAFCENVVAAYAVTRVKDEMVDLVTWKCDYERFNNMYPSYGLVFVMTEYYLGQPGINYVNDGNKSFTEHSSVQDMLIDKFGYRKAYSNLHVFFKWWLKILVVLLSPFEKYIKNNVILSFVRMYKWSV